MRELLTCDANHVYWRGDHREVGTNEILNLYFPPTPFYSEEGRETGTARHAWFGFLAKGLEPSEEPNPRIAGAVAGFRKFLAEVKPVYRGGEEPFYDPILQVCGTPDWYGDILGVHSVLDFKPATANKRTPLQLAAYKLNLMANNIPIVNRYELRLLDGDYRLIPHTDRDNETHWKVMVAAFFAATHYK